VWREGPLHARSVLGLTTGALRSKYAPQRRSTDLSISSSRSLSSARQALTDATHPRCHHSAISCSMRWW